VTRTMDIARPADAHAAAADQHDAVFLEGCALAGDVGGPSLPLLSRRGHSFRRAEFGSWGVMV